MADWCSGWHEGGFFSSDSCYIDTSKRQDVLYDQYGNLYCKNYYESCPRYQSINGYQSGGCFITTVTCEILDKKDDDKVMNGLRKFRDDVLQKDEKYAEILQNYDVVGPIIANKLKEDENKEKIAETVYESVLTPIAALVEDGEDEKAVEAYYQMTLLFINYYGLLTPYNYIAEHDFGYKKGEFDQKTAGHGTKSKKYVKEQKKILDL